jgi:Fic family protein
MSYLEVKSGINGDYISFVKKISMMGEHFLIKQHIGKNLPTISKEKYLMDNIETLTETEFSFRKKFICDILDRISYSGEPPFNTERKSIKINNLMEAKACHDIIYAEFTKDFIFSSNNIEGSKIPREKVLEIIDRGDTKYINWNEVREVLNSVRAFNYIRNGFKFNIPSVKRLYYILTDGLNMENGDAYPKGFKKIPNIIGNSPTTPPECVEDELNNLLKWYISSTGKVHPLLLAFDFHKKYEYIHPFLDGNGRTGRLIMNKILISGGYFPVIVFKENKLSYFNAIKKARQNNEKKYYKFMLSQAEKTYNLILDALSRY